MLELSSLPPSINAPPMPSTPDSCCNYAITQKVCTIAWNIFSLVIFPIAIVRLFNSAIEYIFAKTLLQATGYLNFQAAKAEILQAKEPKLLTRQTWYVCALDQYRESYLAKELAVQSTITTEDGVDLDTVSIRPSTLTTAPQEQKWVVYFNSNATCYEEVLSELLKLSRLTGANYLTGNYRGVMRSKGTFSHTKDLFIDGKAMVEHLLAQGVQAKNIVIHGRSLGGAVALEVASGYQNEGNAVHVCNDRSFSSIGDFLNEKAGILLVTLFQIATWFKDLEFNNIENFNKIKGNKLLIHSPQDEVITPPASLINALFDEDGLFNKAGEPNIYPALSITSVKKKVKIHMKEITKMEEVCVGYQKFICETLNVTPLEPIDIAINEKTHLISRIKKALGLSASSSA